MRVAGRGGVEGRGAQQQRPAGAARPASVRAAPSRPPRAREPPDTSTTVTNGMSTASTTSRVRAPGQRPPAGHQAGDRAAERRVLADERHRPAGRHRLADHDHLGGVAGRGQRVLEEGRPGVLERRLVGAVEARGGPAGEDHGRELHRARSLAGRPWRLAAAWQPGRRRLARSGRLVAVTLRVALVQHASGLEPEGNRRLLGELTPDDADLVVFPEAFARDFGPAGDDVGGYAEPVDGPFVTRGRAAGRRAVHDAAGGDVRGVGRPGAALQHARRCAGRPRPTTARSTSTTPSATSSPTGSAPVRSTRSPRRWGSSPSA